MHSLNQSRDEFAARRRKEQDALLERMLPLVKEALETDNWDKVLDEALEEYKEGFEKESDRPVPAISKLIHELKDTLEKADKDSDPKATALMLATAVLNASMLDAAGADGDVFLEWVTMHDNKVRDTHKAADGQKRPPGHMFDVGGVKMPYPGFPGAPVGLWINCRCVLKAVDARAFTEETENLRHTVVDSTEIGEVKMSESTTWHGVLVPEGVRSGDGRMFKEGSLRNRELPLPLTWQKISDEGHDSNVTVAKIDYLERVGNEIRARGTWLDIVEAQEAQALVKEFGRFGVSIDADDVDQTTLAIELDDGGRETLTFSDARICSACILPIPAFQEAWVADGDAPEDFFVLGTDAEVDEIAASIEDLEFRDVSTDERKSRAKDGTAMPDGSYPIANCGDLKNAIQAIGRAKNPSATKRHIRKRKAALGCPDVELPDSWAVQTESLAAAGGWCAPSEWFKRPDEIEAGINFSDDDKRTFGYIAEWGVCHISYPDTCVEAPQSPNQYAYFETGQIQTDDGGRAYVGTLTVSTGHAAGHLGARPAAAHYDNTGTAWAYVSVGEDERGIWYSGMVKPGTDPDLISEIKASGRLSGDWRDIKGDLEMVAALTINVGGFPTPNPRAMVASGHQVSLVAAGISSKDVTGKVTVNVSIAPEQVAAIAAAVVDENESRAKRRERMAALREKVSL